MTHPYDALRARLARFVEARDWEQFHTQRNLAACLSVEAGELLELFMWTRDGPGPHPPGAGPPDAQRVREEVGDIFLSLLNFCAAADIDLPQAALEKLAAVEAKYPVERARGVALKSGDLPARVDTDAAHGESTPESDVTAQDAAAKSTPSGESP